MAEGEGEKMRGLTPRQETFCMAYVANGRNATRAAVDSGYSEKNAQKIGSQLIVKSRAVQDRIAELSAPILEKLEISAERVLDEVAACAFGRADKVFRWGPGGVLIIDMDQVPEEQRAAVAEVSQTFSESSSTVRLKMHDKLSALKLLGQYLKLWGDNKIEVTMPWAKELAAMTADELRARADALRAAREKG